MKFFKNMSIKIRLIMIIVVAITLTSGSITAVLISRQSKSMESQMYVDASNIAKAYQLALENIIKTTNRFADAQKLTEAIGSSEGISYAVLLDSNCKGIADSKPADIGKSYADDPATVRTVKEKQISKSFWTNDAGIKILDYQTPVDITIEGNHVASLDIGLSLDILNKSIAKSRNESLLFLLGFIVLFSIVASIPLTVLIIKPVKAGEKIAAAIAEGDLTPTAKVYFKDEIGRMVESMMIAKDKLRGMIGQIQLSSKQVTSSSEQLDAAMSEVNIGIESITKGIDNMTRDFAANAEAVKQTTEAVVTITSNSQKAAEASYNVTEYTQVVRTSAINGKESVEAIVNIIKDISESSKDVQNVIKELETSTVRISDIVHIISQISEQTNMLALNAAIEAARAGEFGKGFAIVAEEIRKLDEQSRESLKGIVELTSDIRRKTGNVVAVVAATEQKVLDGVRKADITKDNINEIITSIQNVISKISEISSIVTEQAAAMQEMSASMDSINESTNKGAGTAQEMSASIEEQVSTLEEIGATTHEMNAMAERLNKLTSQFKL
ncbi:MAG: methyl-accepting chemotaxis protein [Clostridia bacterium]|nr:methyl-accepting chemotaxis protein [Clostridia bacterium]